MRSLTGFVPLLLIVAVFYFLVIRPQRNRQRKQQSLVSALVPGQRVVTTAGMYATVIAVEDGEVILEQAPGVQARFVKQAVGRVVDDAAAGASLDYTPPAADGPTSTDEDLEDPYRQSAPEGGATASGSYDAPAGTSAR